MDEMIQSDLIKELRKERSWSQDQLASVSGLSHRTVQRIEATGRCSLESKKALAAAFELGANDLSVDTDLTCNSGSLIRGPQYGFWGAGLGFFGAYFGITVSLYSGSIDAGTAGIYYGTVGALVGVSCAVIGLLTNGFRESRA